MATRINVNNRLTYSKNTASYVIPWVRNPSWLSLPTVTSSDQKLVGLYAVYPNGGNFVALSATTSSGTYTVNFGDGSGDQAVTSATTKEYEYDFTDADLVGTDAPVTFTVSTSTVNRTAHGYSNGNKVTFYRITSTTGLNEGQDYYVVNATADTFKVSSQPAKQETYVGTINNTATITSIPSTNGLVAGMRVTGTGIPDNTTISSVASTTSIVLSNTITGTGSLSFIIYTDYTALSFGGSDGTAALTEYRQAIITVTPTTANMTAINLNLKHTNNANAAATDHWLDISLSIPNASSTGIVFSAATSNISHGDLERCRIYHIGSCTSFAYLFQNCYSLESVTLPAATSGVTTMYGMYNNCWSIQEVPLFNTASVTDWGWSHRFCYSLISVPLYNMAACTSMYYAFEGCQSLASVPLWVFPNFTGFWYTFIGCYSLVDVPLWDTSAFTGMSGAFRGCRSLKRVPKWNLSNVTSMTQTFYLCGGLEEVPLWDLGKCTNFNTAFQQCATLPTVPLFNTASATDMNSMFNGCQSLLYVPLFNTSKVTTMNSTFAGCSSLTSVPQFNTSAVTDMTSMFFGCVSLQQVPHFNTSSATSMSNMFRDCNSLLSVPNFDTSKVTNMSIMFQSCFSLQRAPMVNTSLVTSMANTFYNCLSLEYVPLMNTSLVTSMTNMFNNCQSLKSVPALITSNVASGNLAGTFTNCFSLSRIQASQLKYTFTVANARLSANALNEIYTNLPTVSTQTITVTGNYGTAGDDPTIATAKGWTVTG